MIRRILAFALLTSGLLAAQDVSFPGITIIPSIVAVKSEQKMMFAMGMPGARPSDGIFVYVQTKDPDAKAYLVSLRYSWLGVVYASTQTVAVTGTMDQAYQALAIFDIPDMAVRVLGLTVDVAQTP